MIHGLRVGERGVDRPGEGIAAVRRVLNEGKPTIAGYENHRNSYRFSFSLCHKSKYLFNKKEWEFNVCKTGIGCFNT